MIKKGMISICGNASLPESDHRLSLAESLGKRLVDEGYRILTGGLGGVMEAASRGARSSDLYHAGDVIGIIPGYNVEEANEYVDIAIATGMDHLRNQVVSNSDAVVAIGGGAGTMSEIAFAWMLKRLVIAYEVEGWSGKVSNMRIDHRIRYNDIPDDRVYGVNDAEEVVIILCDLLPKYQHHHHGIRRRC